MKNKGQKAKRKSNAGAFERGLDVANPANLGEKAAEKFMKLFAK